MLEQMIKDVIGKTLETERPHLSLPAVVCATIVSASPLPETHEVKELTIINDAGGAFQGRIVAPWYEYTLSIIDRFGNVDETFPPIPGIKSKKQFETGAVVAIALTYGDISPAIIGEVVS